jgi:predicted TIM-barrel fold metal-dependent hydrolase
MATTAAQTRVIDSDSHLTEPPDLWTKRLPSKWADDAPRVEWSSAKGEDYWRIGKQWCAPVGGNSLAGWPEPTPSHPPTFDKINPECYDAQARASWMDRYGIERQVLYPNLVAFEGQALMSLNDPTLAIACVRAYNDYLAEFSGSAPGRFIPIAAMPFWDENESIKEMQRCRDLGFPGLLWAATLDKHGLPGLTDASWDRFYAVAQDLEMSINLHVGVGQTEDERNTSKRARGVLFGSDGEDVVSVATPPTLNPLSDVARTSLNFLSNARTVAEIVTSGVCQRFPSLNFVSVESGFGYLVYLLEALDWQWGQLRADKFAPDLPLPSETFRRQVYATFWFEHKTLALLSDYADNVMFETDFPHPTSLSPGPGSASPRPDDLIKEHFASIDDDTKHKVLYANAARVYHIDGI